MSPIYEEMMTKRLTFWSHQVLQSKWFKVGGSYDLLQMFQTDFGSIFFSEYIV